MGGVHTLMEASVDMEVAARQMRAPVSLGLTITADGTTLAKLAPAQPIVSPVPPFYEAVVIPAAKRVVENLVFENKCSDRRADASPKIAHPIHTCHPYDTYDLL